MTKWATLLITCVLVLPGLAQEAPPTVEIPAERLELALGDPLSTRALVTRPLPITGVMGWSLESRRHRGAIWCDALSPDGRTLATGGLDGTIRLWSVDSGRLVRALIGHNSYVSSLDWSPDGNTLASAGTYDITVRLWDTRSGRPLRILKGHPREVTRVRWAPDGKSVAASGSASGVLSSWHALTGVKRNTIELGQPILDLAWQPDGLSLAVVCQTAAVQLWDPDKNKVSRSIGAANDASLCVAWAPDGKHLAAGNAKSTFVYESGGGKMILTLQGPGHAVRWARDGKRLATLSSDSIKVWDAQSGSMQATMAVVDTRSLHAAGDFARFMTTSATAFAVHDVAEARTRRFDDLSGTAPPLWWSGRALITGVGTPKLSLWDPDTGKRLRTLEGHTAAISAVTLAPNGKLLASASHDKSVRLWDIATGKPAQTFAAPAATLAVAFAPDGKLIASSAANKQITIWDPATGKLLHTLEGSASDVTALAWKPGASTTLLSNGMQGSVQIWNARAGKLERTVDGGHDVVSLAWAPDGSRAAAGHANGAVHVWQSASGKLIHDLDQPGSPPYVSSLAWAPSGLLLAAGRGNHTMQLWELKSGKQLHSVPTMAPVERVSWTAGGSTVGVSSHDRTLRFVDAATGKLRALLLAEDEQLIAVHFDGHYRAPDAERDLVYVVQTRNSQDTYTPSQFATKHKLKNTPAKVILFGK